MVVFVDRQNKISLKLENHLHHHQHEAAAALQASLEAFRSDVSVGLNRLLLNSKPGSDFLSSSRSKYAEFVLHFQNCMERIVKPVLIEGKFILQHKMKSVCVNSIADWRGLKGSWDSGYQTFLPSSRLKRQWIQDNSSVGFETDGSVDCLKSLQMQSPESQQFLSFTLFPDEDGNLQLKIGPTHEYLGIDGSFLASLPRSKSAMAAVKQLKISKLPDPQFLVGLKVYISLQTLEFDGCLFHSKPPGGYFPTTLIKLKITNCINSEHILAALMCQKSVSLESLEINGCSSLYSFPIDKLPVTLRQLKIVSCMDLKSLSESSEIKNCHSVVFGPVGDSGLPNLYSSGTLELRELEIWDCKELEFLPGNLHNLTHLDRLSISNCSSLVSFPKGGLPTTCITSLLIFQCENLKYLPNQLHNAASLQTLSVCSCPRLMSFPEGGLPPNLVSLHIIDCQNLITLSHWELHKLEHLRNYSIIGGSPDLGE